MAPRPTKANCPRESCPPQPVSIVTDNPTMANTRTRPSRKVCDAELNTTGSRAATTTATAPTIAPPRRTHHTDRSRCGTGRIREPSDSRPVSGSSSPPRSRTSARTTTKRRSSDHDGSATFANTTASTTPMAMPPASASGSETSRPTSAAARARSSRPGPSASETDRPPTFTLRSGLTRTTVRVDSTPARVHTMVDTRRVLMAASSAASRLSAAARMARPHGVRCRNRPRPTTTAGTKARIMKCGLVRTRLPTVSVRCSGDGNGPACSSRTPGSSSWATSMSWATPMVATSRASCGPRASRRITVTSTSAPTAPPPARTTTRAIQKFQPSSRTSLASTAAPNAPISPWAKLMTPVARYTSTRPAARTA